MQNINEKSTKSEILTASLEVATGEIYGHLTDNRPAEVFADQILDKQPDKSIRLLVALVTDDESSEQELRKHYQDRSSRRVRAIGS